MKMKTLYVLYKPGFKCTGSNAVVLSFMPPDDEHAMASSCPQLLYGRKEMDAIREKARRAYVEIISRIAATPCDGKTLRQTLEMPDMGNPWWYHTVSEKQAESDNTFNLLLQIFTVSYIAEREKIEEIVVCGAPVEIARVLKTRYKVSGIRCFSSWKGGLIRALFSRIRYLFNSLHSYEYIQRNLSLPVIRPDVVLQGYWDWSVQVEEKNGKISDKYFKSLPDKFESRGMKCAWFLWFDPRTKCGESSRPVLAALRSAAGNQGLVFVQKFLKICDILAAIFDLRPFYRYIRYSRSDKFKSLFREEGYDLWSIFSRKLAYGFCDSSMPHHFLIEKACRRAFNFYKPKLSFAFLELFLSSRAFNQGAMLGSPMTIRCDMQHAGCAREKTFILADPLREFGGEPDKKAMPLPENFFVMGELYREILIENGFPSEKIFVTGSARFDHLTRDSGRSGGARGLGSLKVLIVSTVNVPLDFEMIQAAFLAREGLNIELYLRSHPLVKIEHMSAYKRYGKNITSLNASLEEDLGLADLVMFTYSTVAEEAFLRGIPVLRWQANGFNGSVFRDVDVVPSAYSVESLRRAFKKFLDDPISFKPDEKLKDLVLQKCFYMADGMASYRIAEKAVELLSRS